MTGKAVKEALEKAVLVAVVAFVAVYSPVVLGAHSLGGLLDLSVADKAATAGVAALFSLLVSWLGTLVGDKDSTSFHK